MVRLVQLTLRSEVYVCEAAMMRSLPPDFHFVLVLNKKYNLNI